MRLSGKQRELWVEGSLPISEEAEVKAAANGGGRSCCKASLICHMSQGARAPSGSQAGDSHVFH